MDFFNILKLFRAFLEVHKKNNNEIVLNTPNRNEILKEGPPENSNCNILGRGAYGTVFKAIFQAKQVAVKIVKNLRDINLQSMRNEAHILGWNHRNIVKILKIESTSNFGIVIMERFSGHCLQTIIDSVDLPLVHRVYISLDILSALSYCHKRMLLHLDVKPQNVLMSLEKINKNACKENWLLPNRRSYICKICDFGSSMSISEQATGNMSAGIAKGTVRYMSPEVLRAERFTPAADIYSLGITMWQLQHRRLPYSWIQCNEVVAYQVVKNNLRPDADGGPLLERFTQRCFCDNFSSEISYQCLKHINDFLNRREQEQKEVLHLSQCELNRLPELSAARKPFQTVKTNSNWNSKSVYLYPHTNGSVVRDLHSELDLITPFDSAVDINLAAIFRTHADRQYIHKEDSYEEIYKCCWQCDYRSRPKSTELRKSLKHLL